MKTAEMTPPAFSFDDLPESEPPPPYLYKYMVAERVSDVLGGGMVRFTHLLDTNDTFEVRKTFRQFAGPKFIDLMTRATHSFVTPEYVSRQMQRALAEKGIRVRVPQARKIFKKKFGLSVDKFMRTQMVDIMGPFAGALNAVQTPEEFLHELGSTILCFSLSERYDLPTMWAHYGGGHTGVVLSFDTAHRWFKQDKQPEKSRLQKVTYFDDQLEEPFENVDAAFMSKTTDWAYEREWRLNCGIKDIERTVGSEVDPIHLRPFPSEALHSVIVGAKVDNVVVDQVRGYLGAKYPHAKLQRAVPQPMAGKYDLEDI